MSPDAQRIAIAEACGWTNIDKYLGNQPLPFTREFIGGTDDGLAEGEDTLGHQIKPLPDYLNDLNAMHEVEKALEECVQADFARELFAVIGCSIEGGIDFSMAFEIGTASPAHHAEAFLRVLGKWEGAK